MDCSYALGFNFNDVFQCLLANSGVPFDAMALLILAIFVIFAAISRIDFDLSLGFAIALTWALMVVSGGGSIILQYIMGLLVLGFGLRILMAIIGIFRQ
jgi:hypothetical protein